MKSFGASGPYKALYQHFGITPDAVVAAAEAAVVALSPGAVLPSPLLHAATTMAPTARTAKNDGAVRMGALSAE